MHSLNHTEPSNLVFENFNVDSLSYFKKCKLIQGWFLGIIFSNSLNYCSSQTYLTIYCSQKLINFMDSIHSLKIQLGMVQHKEGGKRSLGSPLPLTIVTWHRRVQSYCCFTQRSNSMFFRLPDPREGPSTAESQRSDKLTV